MYKRNYQKEYETDKNRDSRLSIRIHKEDAEKFKEKLQRENKTMSEFVKEQIEKYVKE